MGIPATHNIPLRQGIPYWVGIVITFVLLVPNMMLNGAYTGNASDIAGSLGVINEDITMAYYAASAGMAITYPLIPLFRGLVTTKSIILADLVMQMVLAFICANATHIEVNIICSFFIGVLRAFLMLEIISILMPFFSPSRQRPEFYSYFYPLVFGFGQVSTTLTALLAYNYQWQYMYYLIIGLQLLAMILVMVFFRYGRKPIRIPIAQIDFVSIVLISSFFLLAIFAATYGKVLDWFWSPKIIVALSALPLLLWMFVWRQKEGRYVNLSVLRSGKAIIGYIFMSLAMFFNISSSLVNNYTTSVLRIDSVHSNTLSLWSILGYVIAAVICFWWFRYQKYRFRVLVFWSMSFVVAYFAILYFGLRPDGTFEFLILPTVLRGMGVMVLFIAFGVYAVEDLKQPLMIHNAFFLISVRSVFVPVVCSSLLSNLMYLRLQTKIMELGQGLDLQNPFAMEQYNHSFNTAIAAGNSIEEAGLMATNNLANQVMIQATMSSLKEIMGWFLILAVVLMVASRFIHFHKTVKVQLPTTDIDMA